MSKILKLFMMLILVASCSKKDNQNELVITDDEGNKTVYTVELAQTRDELTTGLMNRTQLDADAGMIFDLSPYGNVPTAMWMKDTPLALDMIFIDKDGMIYWLYENAEPNSQKLIIAPYSAAAVLEVNAGDIKAKNIKIGDKIQYKLFPMAEENSVDENTQADNSKTSTDVTSDVTENEISTTKPLEDSEEDEVTTAEEDVTTTEEVEEETNIIENTDEKDTDKNGSLD